MRSLITIATSNFVLVRSHQLGQSGDRLLRAAWIAFGISLASSANVAEANTVICPDGTPMPDDWAMHQTCAGHMLRAPAAPAIVYSPNPEDIQRQRDAQQREQAGQQNQLGMAAFQRGDFAAAITHFQAAARMAPDSSTYQQNLRVAVSAKSRETARRLRAVLSDLSNEVSRNRQLTVPGLAFAPSNKPQTDLGFSASRKPSADLGFKPAKQNELSFGTPVIGSVTSQDSPIVSRGVASTRAALQKLNRAIELDAEQRKELYEETEQAAVDIALSGTEVAIEAMNYRVEIELKRALDPKRRQTLERLHKTLDEYSDSIGNGGHFAFGVSTSEAIFSKENGFELCWAVGEKAGVVPVWAAWFKRAVDAAYDVDVIYQAATRASALNENAERYLTAVNKLKSRMEAVVRLH